MMFLKQYFPKTINGTQNCKQERKTISFPCREALLISVLTTQFPLAWQLAVWIVAACPVFASTGKTVFTMMSLAAVSDDEAACITMQACTVIPAS